MNSNVPIYGFGGGGGSGAALTVTAPAGVTVTVSKDGKSKKKTANSSGIAVFKGLSTGEWTVTITDGEKTASKPVTIISDFNKTITFFSATIHVTYPAGSTCTATDGVTTLTAPDTSGTWDCVVPNAGAWTVTVVDKGWTKTVNMTNSGQSVNVDLTCFYLYDYGDQCTAVTGGWGGTQTNAAYTTDGGKLTVNGDNLSFTNVSYGSFGITPKNGINLTGYTMLYVLYTGKIDISVADTFPVSTSAAIARIISDKTYSDKTELALDVSAVAGSHKIAIGNMNTDSAYVYKVWMT